MIKFILLLIVIIASDIFGMGVEENTHMLERKEFPAVEDTDVASAEGRLNQERDPKVQSDVVLVLRYLINNGWTTEEIGVFFDSDSDRVTFLLKNNAFCDLITDMCRYYTNGGESVIGLKPPHERKTNWLDAVKSYFSLPTQNDIKPIKAE